MRAARRSDVRPINRSRRTAFSRYDPSMAREFGWIHPATVGKVHYGASRAPDNVFGCVPKAVRLGTVPSVAYDQGSTPSCVAQALARAVRIVSMRDGYPDDPPSRTDIHYRAREREGAEGVKRGCMIASAVEVLRCGWLPETQWPHATEWGPKWTTKPPALPADAPRLINAEAIAITHEDIVWEVASGNPVVLGCLVTEAWETLSGNVLPEVEGPALAGHAFVVSGYDLGMECLWIDNSWGFGWGDGGSCFMPFDWLRLGVCGEAFAIRNVRRAA